MSDVVETVLRTAGGFALILLLERLLGKRTITKMNYRDFVGATMAGTVASIDRKKRPGKKFFFEVGSVSVSTGNSIRGNLS